MRAHSKGPREATDPDSEDIARVLAGCPTAYAEIVRRHEPTMRRLVLGILGDPHLVEDVLQEVFLIGYRKLAEFRGDALFGTWLFRVAIREAGRARRKHQRHAKARPIDDAVFPPRTDSDALRARRELRDVLEQLSSLPVRPRTAFLLHVVEGRSHAEIADILDTRPGTVGSWIHRARARLREDATGGGGDRPDPRTIFGLLEVELRSLAGLPQEAARGLTGELR